MAKELRMERKVVFTERPPFPENMLVELTNKCNHQCIFCHYRLMSRKKADCNREFTFDIIKQAYDNGTREIGFYMIGEPFLKRDLEEYIAYAHNLGFTYIYLTTNGALATLERTVKCIEAGLNSIKFSINAATTEHYIQIHGHDDYETVKTNVRNLSEYVRKNNIDLSMFITFVKTNITLDDFDLLLADFSSFVDKIYECDCNSQGTPIIELINNGIVNSSIYLKENQELCQMVFNRLHITSEGYLNACCADAEGLLSAVDLHKVSLKEAWHSDIMVNLRRQFLNNTLSKDVLCYNCLHKEQHKVKPLNEALWSSNGR